MNAKVSKLRSRISEIQSELEHLASGEIPQPLPAALAQADAITAQWQEAGAERVKAFAFACARGHQVGPLCPITDHDSNVVLELLAALDPALIRTRLHSAIESVYADIGEALTADEISARRAALIAELFKAEQADFALSAELGIGQRADCDPRVLLLGN